MFWGKKSGTMKHGIESTCILCAVCLQFLLFSNWALSYFSFVFYIMLGLLLQIRGMHTLIRDREIKKHDFVFYSDRLIRLVCRAFVYPEDLQFVYPFVSNIYKRPLIFQVVEHGLGYLPFTEKQVITPTGVFEGEGTKKKYNKFRLDTAISNLLLVSWHSTPGSVYTGVDFCKKLCGVSIIRRWA